VGDESNTANPQQRVVTDSKSSVITPLLWTLVILLTGLLASIGEEAKPWVVIFFATLMGATILLMIWTYACGMMRAPSALRSEKYTGQAEIKEPTATTSQDPKLLAD
jgi:hypothetical protein